MRLSGGEAARLPLAERSALRSEIDVDALEQLLGRLPEQARHLILMLCRSEIGPVELADALRAAGDIESSNALDDQHRILRPRFADPELAALWKKAIAASPD